MYLDEFCDKDVISICDCRKIGKVYNLQFDECTGCICELIVREKSGLCSFFSTGEETTIPFCKIKQIGEDIILVDV